MKARLAALALTAALLGGCGGSGTGGVGATPAPPPPAPPPPPPPTNSSLADLSVSQTFDTASATLVAGAAPGDTHLTLTSASRTYGSDFTIDYEATSQSYTVTQGTASSRFTPADMAAQSASVTSYVVADGTLEDSLLLSRPGESNTTIQLTYTGYGAWQDAEPIFGTGGATIAARFFVYGIATAPDAMPRSGSAAYNTAVDGIWIEDVSIHALVGESLFEVNFGSGSILTTMVLDGRDVDTGVMRSFDTFTGTGAIVSGTNRFGGTFAGTASGYDGPFNGAFFGPSAAEMGLAFELNNGVNGVAVGALTGTK